ncbi:hypothetical protein EXIGLDRAFT_622286 [Exidia glandulosa HHB12029]|uniref:Uncharacterized protein n=1 Tax=Exidia glandulosa HHB12029 TaxID=1314781 RepID=A0A165ZW02_EXIGL|nr:hypothetical protein EXIGLDRAFT_622286 [Exidia glandulosa HHB12029]
MDHLIETFEPHDEDGAARSYDHIIGVPVHHRASVTHERPTFNAAAGFTAMKMYEDHLRASGEEPSHSLMKEMLAGIAAAEVDKLVETKGLDHLDRHRVRTISQ